MKALVLEEYGKFVYKEAPVPKIGPNDVLVEVKACSVCGSDVHGMDGSTGRRKPPIIMGHVAAGVVAKVGTEVKNVIIGDRVTFDSTIYCGECDYCLEGRINLCDKRRVLGVSCDEYKMDGAFAEYVSVPARVIYKLPDTVTFEQASMIEPLSVAFHAVEQARVRSGNAVVIGCGTIGLLIAQLLQLKGFSRVIAADVAIEKLELAKSLGFVNLINTQEENILSGVKRLTNGEGIDLSIDAVGVENSVMNALKILKKGAECVLVGNLSPTVTIPLQEVVTKQITILGSCVSAGEYPVCLAHIADGKVNVEKLASKIVPLADGNEWIQKVYNRDPGLYKIILIP